MGKRTSKTETHTFYCLNCAGAFPLARRTSNQKEKMHRKKLYCPYCKNTVNMVECKNYTDKLEFMSNFEKGLYKEEALASIQFVEGN